MVRPRAWLSVMLVLSALGCGRASEGSNVSAPSEPAITTVDSDPISQPRWLLVPFGTELRTALEPEAASLRVMGGADSGGRVVEVVGRERDHWVVQTIDEATLDAADVVEPAIEGLDFYQLRLYVPVGIGRAIEPDPAAKAAADAAEAARPKIEPMPNTTSHRIEEYASNHYPPIQSNAARSKAKRSEWDVSEGAKVHALDGRELGVVRRWHAFAEPGVVRDTPAGALVCFVVASGPEHLSAGELCFDAESVKEELRAGATLIAPQP